MARILAVDWDSHEVRFVLGNTTRNALVLLKTGSLPLETPTAIPAESAPLSDNESNVSDEKNEPDSPEHQDNPTNASSSDGQSSENGVPSETSGEEVETVDSEASEQPDGTAETEDTETKQVNPEQEKERLIGTVLKTLLKKHRIGSAVLCLAVARSEVETLQLDVPPLSETELPDVVKNLVLRESTSYIEGQPLDFLPLKNAKGESREVVSVSISRARLKSLRTSLSAASRRPAKIEYRGLALAELLKDRPLPKYDDEEEESPQQVLMVGQVSDEVHLVICSSEGVGCQRTFKLPAEITPEQSRERLVSEIVRTIALGTSGPDTAPVNRVILLDRENIVTANGTDESAERSSSNEQLVELLADHDLSLQTLDPFRLPGIELKTDEPEQPGRYAALVGMLMAEQANRKPLLDLLHPHQKPKPPNYPLFFAAMVFLIACVAGYGWIWNRGDLAKQKAELAGLENQRKQLADTIGKNSYTYQILNTASRWDNSYGVIVLDELRDITIRIPKAPDMIVTRLAYTGNYRGRPVFIISGKVTSPLVYQQFFRGLTGDRSHSIASAGPKPINDGGGFSHEFSAQIFCMRRPWNMYWQKLPQNVQQISNSKPEQMK